MSLTFRLHQNSNQHHREAHPETADNHGIATAPAIHEVHVRPSEDVEDETLDAVGEQGALRGADASLLEEEDGVVHYPILVVSECS